MRARNSLDAAKLHCTKNEGAMRKTMRKQLLTTILLTTGVMSVAPGCGQIAAEMAEQMERQRHSQKFVFDDPLDRLWKEVAIATREGGCFLPAEPKVGETVVCANQDGSRGRDWMNVRITAVEGGHRVEIIRMGEERDEQGNWKPKPGRRADDLEFTLISRLHPKAAAEIDALAEAKRPAGEQAGKVAGELVKEGIERELEAREQNPD
jgi:hypothetical protein